jgi:nitrogen fixation protein FixH
MMWFYVAGLANLVLGMYVLIQGPALLGQEKAMFVMLVFFAFAAVNLYFPKLMWKQWMRQIEQAHEALQAQQAQANQAKDQAAAGDRRSG